MEKASKLAGLSLVFPAHNEAGNLVRVLTSAKMAGRSVAREIELIVVDDGSTDETTNILSRLEESLDELVVIRHTRNRGYGAALLSGFRKARFESVFYTDADGQFLMNELPLLVAGLEDADIVTGYRLKRRDSLYRRIQGRAWSLLVRLSFDVSVTDVDCAFKIFPRSLVQDPQLRSEGALIDAEVLALARERRLRVKEVPVTHLSRTHGKQSGASIKVVLKALREFVHLRRRCS